MNWNYQRTESDFNFKPIPEGKHRVRIASVKPAKSSAGNDMLNIMLDVSGYAGYLFTRIVFLNDKPEVTNSQFTQFYDSFKDIPDGCKDLSQWIGKVGACKVRHEEHNGNMKAEVHYFIHAKYQGDLPAWKEPERKGKTDNATGQSTSNDGFMQIPDGAPEETDFF